MTRPTNTFSSYEVIGTREDLRNFISNISPTDFPFMNMAGKGDPAESTLVEWQTDALASPNTSNAQVEADDVTPAAATPTTRINNRTQISNASVVVSRTIRNTRKAGRKNDELSYQIVKKTKELKRDKESILVGNQGAAAGSSTTARTTRSLESWYATNVNRGTGGANGTATAGATDGTTRALTESLLKDVIQKVWTSGGDVDTVMANGTMRQNISGFTGNATRMVGAEDKALFASISVYHSDFGDLKIVANRFQRTRTVHVLQSDMWQMSHLGPDYDLEDLAKTGDADKKFVVTEYALVAKNEAASGVIADLA